MTKKNKLILIILICIVAVIAISATIVIIVLNNRDNKWKDVGNKDYTPPSENTPYEPIISYDIVVDRGLEEEYYLNQEFDINKVYIYYRKIVDGRVEWAESVRCAPAFIKGYPETPIPNTDTLGTKSFTLTYLGLDCDVSFNVVEYNEMYAMKFINSNTYLENDSLFGVLGAYISSGDARTYMDNIKGVIADSVTHIGPLVFMRNIQDFIEMNRGGESGSENNGLWGNPNNPNETASLSKVGNLYIGTIWVITEHETYKLEFELEYYPIAKGLRIDMTVNGTDYGVYISSTENTYNLVISGTMTDDVIMTYGAEKIYLSTCDAGLYRTIYNNAYDETFGSTGNAVLEFDRDTFEYEKR